MLKVKSLLRMSACCYIERKMTFRKYVHHLRLFFSYFLSISVIILNDTLKSIFSVCLVLFLQNLWIIVFLLPTIIGKYYYFLECVMWTLFWSMSTYISFLCGFANVKRASERDNWGFAFVRGNRMTARVTGSLTGH